MKKGEHKMVHVFKKAQKKEAFTLAERIFAQRLCEQTQKTLKKVSCGICLRPRHDNAYNQTKRFKALDGIMAALKERSRLLVRANNSRPAFTLAETLTALTVIGVIAAITVPALVQKTNKQEYVSALKKAYSTLSQATQMIIAEEGSPKGEKGGWANTAENVYLLYKKYLSNVKDCSTDSGCFNQLSGNVRYKYLKGGTHGDSFNTAGRYKLILADGTQVLFIGPYPKCNYYYTPSGTKDSCEEIYVDINGEKAPNTFGRDVFLFELKENGLYPAGCDDETQCGSTSYGIGCACKVLREGAMNY